MSCIKEQVLWSSKNLKNFQFRKKILIARHICPAKKALLLGIKKEKILSARERKFDF